MEPGPVPVVPGPQERPTGSEYSDRGDRGAQETLTLELSSKDSPQCGIKGPGPFFLCSRSY